MAGITKLRHVKADGTVEEYDIDGGNYGDYDSDEQSTIAYLMGASSFFNSTISYVKTYGFRGMDELQTLDLPNCTFVASQGFRNCKSLSNVSLPKCSYVDIHAFTNCSALKEIVLPMCSVISSYAFQDTGLERIVLPKCKSFGSSPFVRCSNLSEIRLEGPNVCSIRSNVFNTNNLSILRVYVPTSMVEAYKSNQYWSVYSSIIVGV